MSVIDRLREMLSKNPSARLALQSSLTGTLLVKREFEEHNSEWIEFKSAIDADIGEVVVQNTHIIGFLHHRKIDRVVVQLAR